MRHANLSKIDFDLLRHYRKALAARDGRRRDGAEADRAKRAPNRPESLRAVREMSAPVLLRCGARSPA